MTDRTGPIARTVLAAQSDERLVKLLREGHGQAFEEIVRRYRGPLVGFATAIVNHDRAEDVVQTALEKAHGALLADDREINLRPWLFTIVRNGSLNLIRSEPLTDELDPLLSATAGSGPEQVAERNEEMDRLFTAICALPTAQREALVRRELEGVGHGEIASQLGTTATAVRGLIFRARTQLRNAVGGLVPLPLLRTLLAEGSAVGVAGGGAGAALFGSAGAKGGVAVAAAVIALGAGIAVEKHRGKDHGGDVAVAQAAEQGSPGAQSSGGNGSSNAVTSASDRPAASAGDDGENSGADGGDPSHGQAGHDQPGSGSGGDSGPSGPGPSGSGGSGSGHSGSGHSGSGHSGSGSDDSGSDDAPEPPEHDDDSGHGSDDSGSGGHGSSGHEDSPEELEEPEVEEPEHDSSGPGDGFEEPEEGESSDDDSNEGRH